MLSSIVSNKETKFVESDSDEFEIVVPLPQLSQWRATFPERPTISRAELRLCGIKYPSLHCTSRHLKPLSPSAPERYGLTAAEALQAALPEQKDAARWFENLFKFIGDETFAEDVRRQCAASDEEYVREAFSLFLPEVKPAALSPIIQAAFPAQPHFGRNSIVAKLAEKLLLNADVKQLTGKGAWSAFPQIISLLLLTDARGLPRYGSELACKLFDIISANKPRRSRELFTAIERYRRLNPADWAAEVQAADRTYYSLFIE